MHTALSVQGPYDGWRNLLSNVSIIVFSASSASSAVNIFERGHDEMRCCITTTTRLLRVGGLLDRLFGRLWGEPNVAVTDRIAVILQVDRAGLFAHRDRRTG